MGLADGEGVGDDDDDDGDGDGDGGTVGVDDGDGLADGGGVGLADGEGVGDDDGDGGTVGVDDGDGLADGGGVGLADGEGVGDDDGDGSGEGAGGAVGVDVAVGDAAVGDAAVGVGDAVGVAVAVGPGRGVCVLTRAGRSASVTGARAGTDRNIAVPGTEAVADGRADLCRTVRDGARVQLWRSPAGLGTATGPDAASENPLGSRCTCASGSSDGVDDVGAAGSRLGGPGSGAGADVVRGACGPERSVALLSSATPATVTTVRPPSRTITDRQRPADSACRPAAISRLLHAHP